MSVCRTALWSTRIANYYFYIFHDKVDSLSKHPLGEYPCTCSNCLCREITRGRSHQRPLAETRAELESLPREKRSTSLMLTSFPGLIPGSWPSSIG